MADREAFDRAMSKQDDTGQPADERSSEAPRLFSLFGSGATAVPGRALTEDVSHDLTQALSRSAEQLLVGDESSGKREVRVELKSDVLPGVSVAIFEADGRLVAAFSCRNEDSRERLNAGAAGLAEEWANSLKRAVLVQVTTDDPDDLRLFEAAAQA